MEVNGTLIWYYNICKREVWLMSRNIVPDQNDENIDFGRFLHEQTYKRNKKEISFGNVKFDVILNTKEKLVIGETKKTSKYSQASKWQLLYYLKVLKDAGIDAEGVLLYPEEKKRTEIILNEETLQELEVMKNSIVDVMQNETPPKVEKCKFCYNCGYNEYCYS
jgi:CRISPR-associated exonuclease Cas4